jgi:hypothetical protein
MNRLDVAKLSQSVSLAPSGEFPYSPGVRLAGIRITDIGSKELDEALACVRSGRKQRRQCH